MANISDDFGFEHILWVFSGRRGIHCWVCDQVARHLPGKSRSAVASYLQLIQTVGNTSVVRIGDKMHSSVRRAFRVVEPMFDEIILHDQNLFAKPAGVAKLLATVADDKLKLDLDAILKACPAGDSKAVWTAFKTFILAQRGVGPQSRVFRNTLEEVQLALLYPRLDINVTKGLNHLLKAPFCVHPKTGKVCVPFNPNVAAKFDPNTVPTITQLLTEINAFDDKIIGDENSSANGNANSAVDEKSRIKVGVKCGQCLQIVFKSNTNDYFGCRTIKKLACSKVWSCLRNSCANWSTAIAAKPYWPAMLEWRFEYTFVLFTTTYPDLFLICAI